MYIDRMYTVKFFPNSYLYALFVPTWVSTNGFFCIDEINPDMYHLSGFFYYYPTDPFEGKRYSNSGGKNKEG